VDQRRGVPKRGKLIQGKLEERGVTRLRKNNWRARLRQVSSAKKGNAGGGEEETIP